jgi:hypothetical protein
LPLEAREAGGTLRIAVALANTGLQVRGGIVVGRPLKLDLNLTACAAAPSRFLTRGVGARFRELVELVTAATTSFRVESRT